MSSSLGVSTIFITHLSPTSPGLAVTIPGIRTAVTKSAQKTISQTPRGCLRAGNSSCKYPWHVLSYLSYLSYAPCPSEYISKPILEKNAGSIENLALLGVNLYFLFFNQDYVLKDHFLSEATCLVDIMITAYHQCLAKSINWNLQFLPTTEIALV